MKFYKTVIDGYVVCVSSSFGNVEITETEHESILNAMANKPSKEGYYYKLRDDTLTYDEFKIPDPDPEETKGQ